MATKVQVSFPHEKIAEFCRKNHIRKLALFGSLLRGNFKADSDVDLLVEFEAGNIPGLIRLASMELELAKMLGHRVDLRTPEDLSHYFRQKVINTAEVLYAQ